MWPIICHKNKSFIKPIKNEAVCKVTCFLAAADWMTAVTVFIVQVREDTQLWSSYQVNDVQVVQISIECKWSEAITSPSPSKHTAALPDCVIYLLTHIMNVKFKWTQDRISSLSVKCILMVKVWSGLFVLHWAHSIPSVEITVVSLSDSYQ